jgi:transcriptional regulator with XRE-family HTH domain
MALAYAVVSEAELARRLGTSAQNLNQRLKRGNYDRTEELTKLAEAIGAEFVCNFRFPDGTEI